METRGPMARRYGSSIWRVAVRSLRRLAAALLAACLPALAAARSAAIADSQTRLFNRRHEGSLFQRRITSRAQIPARKLITRPLPRKTRRLPSWRRRRRLIQKQDYAGAEPLLRKVLEGDAANDPANYVAWFELGFVENGLGKRDESIAAYRKSVAAKPDVFESNLNLGLQLAKSRPARCRSNFCARPRSSSRPAMSRRVTRGRGFLWRTCSKRPSRMRPLRPIGQAAALQPKDPEPHLAAGLLLEKQGQVCRCGERIQAGAGARSLSSDAVTGLANIYMRGHRLPEAEAELRKLVAAHPEQADARIQLGRVLAAEGKNDEAIAELQAGEKLAPADASLQRDLADLYVIAKKIRSGRSGLSCAAGGAVRTMRRFTRVWARRWSKQKKFADAQKEFVVAVKLKPDLGAAYGDLAFAASENKEYPLTIKALDVRAKYLPEEPVTYFLRASAYDHLKDVKRAAAELSPLPQGGQREVS